MNYLTERIFKIKKANYGKLLKYGFTPSNNFYYLKKEISDGQFLLTVKITDSDIITEVFDLSLNEPYTLFLVNEAAGSFVGAVRAEYQEVMLDIAKSCFDDFVFKSEYAQKIIQYVENKYGDTLEFLWEKFSDNAIWRRKDNRKWYALLLTVNKIKLGLQSDEITEIIDLRYNPEKIENVVDNRKIFGGYHMNKKHWITICLDGSVELNKIFRLIDESYNLAK